MIARLRQGSGVASPLSSDYDTTDESISSTSRREELTDAPHIPDLELLRSIGSGSYGEVWLARSILGTYRAVKIVQRKAFRDEEAFEREFSGLQRFEPVSREHGGFVAILHVGRNRAEGFFYYVMELADNDSDCDRIKLKTMCRKH
jgi:serine/threonine protein kinase